MVIRYTAGERRDPRSGITSVKMTTETEPRLNRLLAPLLVFGNAACRLPAQKDGRTERQRRIFLPPLA